MSHTQDWSDSEGSQASEKPGQEGYTDVHLGIPSDVIKDEGDLQDAYVSRIGGTPTFLAYPHPSLESSKCKVCQNPSELLVQMLCNLEDSPFERVLYVWGCSKRSCQKKIGSIRAWRSLRYDEKYARKLQKKQEQKKQKQAASATLAKEKTPVGSSQNPFSAGSTNGFANAGFNPFSLADSAGFGVPIFESKPLVAPDKLDTKQDDEDTSDEETESEDDEDSTDDKVVEKLTEKIGATTLGPSVDWSQLPGYTPRYLETESEYLPPPPKLKSSEKAAVQSNKGGGGGDEWGKEMWEESKNVDDVFVKFTLRVDARPSQCVRYDLNGQPLFYQAESVYKSLHSVPAGTAVPVTGAAFAISSMAPHRTYNPQGSALLPQCPICQSTRRFECQLMPNLINKLKRPLPTTEDETMEWGTCLVFTCSKDCSLSEAGGMTIELKECWREEAVLVQWEE